tara:strand:+ start:22181 stop:23002 length:822 start_codon:yes stop_codon:yes gene_type:complete
MKILHPNHTKPLPLNALKEYLKDGIYDIIDPKEREKLNYFLHCFEAYRKSNNLIIKDDSLYDNLPFSIHTDEWKERQKDIYIINKKIHNRKNLNILDVGSWNGWLSNYLAKKGHNVTALNLFRDEYDGLLSKNKYNTKYLSLQIQIEELYRIKDQFDLIIFNRNWAFFKDYQKVFMDAKDMLTDNGEIIITGLAFYKNPVKALGNLEYINKKFLEKYKIPIIYNDSKGFLDTSDFDFFLKNKISLHSYQKVKNLFKFIFPKKAKVYYGSYKKA